MTYSRNLLVLLLLTVSILIHPSSALAGGDTDLGLTLKELEADIGILKALVQKQTRKAVSIQGDVHRLDLEASLARKELQLATTQVEEARTNLGELKDRIRKLEEAERASREEISLIMKRLYLSRIPGTLRLLLASEKPSDLTATQGYLAYFARKDIQRLERYQDVLTGLDDSRSSRESELRRMSHLQESVAVKSTRLDKKLGERKGVLNRLRHDRNAHISNLKELEDAADRLRVMLEGLDSQVTTDETGSAMFAVPFSRLKGLLPWPHDGSVVSRFGRQVNERFKTVTVSKGIDIRGRLNDEVRAVHAGIIGHADWHEGYGKLVAIKHGERFITIYAHLSDFAVSKGDYVRKREVIGHLGDTGTLQGSILHFEIRQRVEPVDPLRWLRPSSR